MGTTQKREDKLYKKQIEVIKAWSAERLLLILREQSAADLLERLEKEKRLYFIEKNGKKKNAD